MANESTENVPSAARRESATDGELSSRTELEAEVTLKQEQITRQLKALREEVRHIPVRQFISDHPLKITAGAAVVGFGFSRWLLGRLGWGAPTPEEYRQQLMDELLETIVDDAAHAVAAGDSTQEAIREAVRSHSPIVFEIEREPEEEAESVAAAAVHTLFALVQPYVQQYLRARLDEV